MPHGYTVIADAEPAPSGAGVAGCSGSNGGEGGGGGKGGGAKEGASSGMASGMASPGGGGGGGGGGDGLTEVHKRFLRKKMSRDGPLAAAHARGGGHHRGHGGGHGGGGGQSEWWRTAVLMVAQMMGTGVLGLPYAFAQLGVVPALAALLALALGAVYSGTLLGRLRLAVPHARVYADLGGAALGEGGRAFVGCVAASWPMTFDSTSCWCFSRASTYSCAARD